MRRRLTLRSKVKAAKRPAEATNLVNVSRCWQNVDYGRMTVTLLATVNRVRRRNWMAKMKRTSASTSR